MAKIQEIHKANPDLKPPTNLLVKRMTDLDRELFGVPELFLPKYILNKFHVVLNRKNKEGKTPADVAQILDEGELAEFYTENIKPHMIRRRLIQGLNDNLVRDITNFL